MPFSLAFQKPQANRNQGGGFIARLWSLAFQKPQASRCMCLRRSTITPAIEALSVGAGAAAPRGQRDPGPIGLFQH